MFDETMHPSDQDLLLCADGESSRRRASMVRRHLEACWSCRARMAEMQRTIGDFVRVHQQGLDSRIPPIDGPRAFLKLQLSAAEQRVRRAPWWRLRFALHPSHLAVVCALALALIIGSGVVYLQTRALPSSALPNAELLPNRSLTPGVTGAAAVGDICSMDHDAVVFPVSDILRNRVFQEYGLRNTSADKYEVDFLISPGLGGTDDIRNLWPQPRFNATWNSFVKDQLEDYLHRSVCAGKIDLAIAQKDVSTDWIAAYKKYFRTNEPVGLTTSDSVHAINNAKNSL